MEIPSKRPIYVDYLFIIIGTGLMALGINCIYDPINMVTGGVTGIAIIIKSFVDLPLWITNLCLNIPLFLIAIKVKGPKFIGRTAFATASLTIWLYIIPSTLMSMDDYVLASVFGGVISGIGIGFVFLARATTGGTDMLAAILQHYFRHYSIAQILQFVDGAVVLCGAYVFGLNKALYAVISIYVISQISDGIIEGLKFSKLAYIISDKYEEIAAAIMENIERGATGLDATGMYSEKKKNLLLCVVSKKEIVQVKEIVARIDPRAFIIVSDVREVLGEGFIEYTIPENSKFGKNRQKDR